MIVVKGTVTGNYALPVRVAVFKEDYTLIGVQLNVTTNYEIEVPFGGDYMVVLTPTIGIPWIPSRKYFEGDVIIPHHYDILPYVFICENSGYSGRAEPLFTTQPFIKFYDEGVEWRLLERIPPSITQFPVKATIGM